MIDIATVLKKLNDTYDEQTHEEKYFGIKFIDRNGLIHETEVRKNVRSAKLKQKTFDNRGKTEVNLKRNGIIMLRERHNTDHPITPKVCMIFGFKDYNSKTWHNVFH